MGLNRPISIPSNYLKVKGLLGAQDAVAVVGYPIGGETISVTTGVVSRIEVTSYSHGATELLGIQIDAAINPGNSGATLPNDMQACGAQLQLLLNLRLDVEWQLCPKQEVRCKLPASLTQCCRDRRELPPTGWRLPRRGSLLQ